MVQSSPARLYLEHADRSHLAAIRQFVETQAAACALSPETVDDLLQAVDEAATNILVHGYHDRPGPLEVEFRCERRSDGRQVRLALRDQAPHFDPRDAPPPNLDLPFHQRKPGGLGIHLMRKCTDGLEHRRLEQGGNELILTKQID